jgi:hypothetical protein
LLFLFYASVFDEFVVVVLAESTVSVKNRGFLFGGMEVVWCLRNNGGKRENSQRCVLLLVYSKV